MPKGARQEPKGTPKEIKKAAEDWKNFKNDMYVVEGNSYQGKQKVIGKVLDIAGRATGHPPGYDLLLLYIDRDCKKCQKNKIDQNRCFLLIFMCFVDSRGPSTGYSKTQ